MFMLLWATTGIARWPDFTSDLGVSLDGAVWAATKCSINLYLVLRMVLDHARVAGIKFTSERDEALWRALYRRSGASPG